MTFTLSAAEYLIAGLSLIGLGLISWPMAFLNLIIGALFLIISSLVIGHWLFIKNSWVCQLLYGWLFVLVIAGLAGTASFYFWHLGQLAQLAANLLILAVGLILNKKHPVFINLKLSWPRLNLKLLSLTVIYLAFNALLYWLLYRSRTVLSIRSPWEVLPAAVFLLYFLATLILYAILRFTKSSKTMLLVSLHAFLSFSVAWLIYQIGFDYDPFIHQTNVKLILENGTLAPKPFYYIGQYGLIIFLHKWLAVSPVILDKLLVPLLAALYLPATIYYAFKDNFKTETRILTLLSLTILIFPYTSFIVTTPQSLANLFSLITILLSLYYTAQPKASLWPLFLLVLMTLTIHPLAGIPLFFFFCLLVFYQHWQKKIKLPKILHQSILWEIVFLGCLALPAAFFINSAATLSQLKVSLSNDWLANILSSLSATSLNIYYRPFISFLDLVYDFGHNFILLLALLALSGFYFIVRHRQLKRYFVYALGFLVVFVNYLLLKAAVSFFSLKTYEQATYPKRVLELGFYLLLPFIIMALYLGFKKILQQKPSFGLLTFTGLALTVTFSFYLSYPRVDKITEDHGYSTSSTDLKTVKFIEEIQTKERGSALTKPYLVLAAQPVSAAAIVELGFKYYYNGYFFYPVPTGNRLYQIYENLAYGQEPTKDLIATARYLTGVNDVYFVLNDYWFNAAERIKEEKELANQWYVFGGKNFIFKYTD